MQTETPRIVVIGGGTGSFTLLSALKNHTANLAALVNMADDGGSTGMLRDELGVLPPGDVRQCLVALSDAPELRDLFNFRFPPSSRLAGHSFGNLFLSALEMMTNNFTESVGIAADILHIKGRVLPVTLDDCQLVMEVTGRKITGQRKVELTTIPPGSRPKLYLTPPAVLTPEARTAVAEADLIVIAPGNLYASLVPALLVEGLAESLQAANAPVVFVCNLVNKSNHTADFAVHDYVAELERFIGPGTIDHVLYNTDIPSAALLKKYALEGEFPVAVDEAALAAASYAAVGSNLLSHARQARNEHDTFIKRSLIRHDAEAVARLIMQLAYSRTTV